jgi:DNA polymerase-3 subunit delta
VSISLFHGGEGYLAEEAFLEAWRKLTADLVSDLDSEMMDAGSSPADVAMAASSVGFFSPGRVIGIRDWKPLMPGGGRRGRARAGDDDPASVAAAALAEIPDGSHILLCAGVTVAATNPVLKLAQQKGEVRGFARLRWRDLVDWAGRRARAVGLELDSAGARALVDAAGDDLRLIDSELQKLSTYAAGQRLGADDVHLLVPDTAEHQVWALTDSLLTDPGRAAIELDRALAAGEPAGRLSYMLVRHLRLVLAASDAPRGAEGGRALTAAFAGDGRPLSDFAVEKALKAAAGVDRARLESLYRRAASTEAASRRGEMDDDGALRLLVMEAAMR